MCCWRCFRVVYGVTALTKQILLSSCTFSFFFGFSSTLSSEAFAHSPLTATLLLSIFPETTVGAGKTHSRKMLTVESPRNSSNMKSSHFCTELGNLDETQLPSKLKLSIGRCLLTALRTLYHHPYSSVIYWSGRIYKKKMVF